MTAPVTTKPGDSEYWDAFVSHAWEDKETFMRPLVEALGRLGVSLWYDEVSLILGNSLSGMLSQAIMPKTNSVPNKCGIAREEI